MSSLTAVARPFRLETSIQHHHLHIRSFTGEEAVSRLFRFRLLVNVDPFIPTADLLGQNVKFIMELGPASVREFLATVVSVDELGPDERTGTLYSIELAPRIWKLTQTIRARVFENLKPLAIIEKVLAQSGIRHTAITDGTDRERPYCVQYFESDFDFIARLLEEEGYIYEHGNDTGEPVLAIKRVPSSVTKLGEIPFHEVTGGPDERISAWKKTRILSATSVTAQDHFFEAGNDAVLKGTSSVPASNPAIPGWESLAAGWSANVDRYPGQWAHLFEEVSMSGSATPPAGYPDFGDKRTWHDLRQISGWTSAAEGASNCNRLAPGAVFQLTKRPGSAGEHFVVSVRHKGSQAHDYSSTGGSGFGYENEFTAVPYAETMMYLPPRATRKPLIHGCQTAKVVGSKAADEIWTDKYGRVQVQFWWDRGNTRSCWVRVASPWAGSNWGIQHIPRVGQEVVVTFLDGDPDRPLIVGSVYNPLQMPPFALPANQTQSGIRTQTVPASAGGSNEIRFEDAGGKEEIYIHAEKNRTEVVENDAVRTVGNDSSDLVSNDRYDVVEGNFHATTGRKFELVTGKSDLTVRDDCMQEYYSKLGINAAEIHLKAAKIVIEGMQISIRTPTDGCEFIHIEQGSGITIDSKGDHVWVNCGGAGSPEKGCFTEPVEPTDPFAPPPDDPDLGGLKN